MIRVTVWNENIHDKKDEVKAVYPEGIHGAVAACLKELDGVKVHIATLDQPECGLPDEVLNNTDVLIWWGHMAHDKVPDELARKVQEHVNRGMGFIGLHSAHLSKPFRFLMGTSCTLRWRDGEYERVWCINPGHPIAEGIPPFFELECEEMYGEFFDIPTPDALVFIGWFKGGEVFRSGCCFNRGYGKIFYFQPGHETYPTYYNKDVQKVIINAVKWANPVKRTDSLTAPNIKTPLEKL